MVRIEDSELPSDIVAELERAVEKAPEAALLDYARAVPEAAQGQIIRPSVIPMVRRYAARQLRADAPAGEPLRALLAAAAPLAGALGLLAESAVEAHWDALALSLGRAPFLAAALVQGRPALRARAAAALAAPAPDAPDAAARAGATRLMQGLLPLFQSGGEEEPEPTDADSQKESERLRRDAARLKSDNDDLRRRLKDAGGRQEVIDRLKKRIEDLERDVQRGQEERKAEGTAHGQTRRQRDDVDAELQALRAELDRRAETLADAKLAATLNAWVGGCRAAERAADALRAPAAPEADALARACAALERQAAEDRHSGNRRELSGRAAALRAALADVRRAAAEAVHPLPELGEAEQALRAELRTLDAALGPEPADGGEFVRALTVRIDMAADAAGLDEVWRLIVALGDAGILDAAALRALYAHHHRRMSVIYESRGPQAARPAATDDPVWQIKAVLRGEGAALLYLDGYNLLHLLPGLFGNPGADAKSAARAREALLARTAAALRGATALQVRAYFDGPEAAEHAYAPTVRAIFSGGAGEHRADRAIADDLAYRRTQPGTPPCVVVTDDRELRRQVRERGAKWMSVHQFGALLEALA